MIKLTYKNIKNINLSYIFYNINYNYYLYILYIKNIKFYLKFEIANKYIAKLE